MSSPRKRRAIVGAVLALTVISGSAPPQETPSKEPRVLPVLFYSFSERSPDFEGEPEQLLGVYKQRIEQVEERIEVSVFKEIFGAENARYHWFEAVPDVFSLRYIAQAWGDSQVGAAFEAMEGLWAPGTYRELVLVPCPAKPVRSPPYQRLILVHRTARAKTIEYARAKAAAVELTDYVNAKRDDVWVQLYENFLGDFGTFHWLVRTTDLATWHAADSSLQGDPEYRELFERTFSHCVEGSLHTGWGISIIEG